VTAIAEIPAKEQETSFSPPTVRLVSEAIVT